MERAIDKRRKSEEIFQLMEGKERIAYWNGRQERKEIKELEKDGQVGSGNKIAKCSPYIDEENVMTVYGRVTDIETVQFNNYPIILDGKHDATRALIAQYYRRFYHMSHDTVINEIKQDYAMTNLRTTLKSFANKCLTCRIRWGNPLEPPMAPLPIVRTAYGQHPFSHGGVNYFGPLMVKVGRRREKKMGCNIYPRVRLLWPFKD